MWMQRMPMGMRIRMNTPTMLAEREYGLGRQNDPACFAVQALAYRVMSSVFIARSRLLVAT